MKLYSRHNLLAQMSAFESRCLSVSSKLRHRKHEYSAPSRAITLLPLLLSSEKASTKCVRTPLPIYECDCL